METATATGPVAVTLPSNGTAATLCGSALTVTEMRNQTDETAHDWTNASTLPCGEGPLNNIWSMTFNLVLMVLFMLTGFLGNLLVVVVYVRNRQRRQSTANYFLCSLAVADLIVCLVAIPIQLHLELSAFSRPVAGAECAVFAYLWHVVMFASAWMLAGISVDRYHCLCRPFDRRARVRQVLRTILLIWLFTIVISVPSALFFEDQCRKGPAFTLAVRLAMAVADGLVSVVVPLLVIAVAYARIFRAVSRREHGAQAQSQRQRIVHQTRYVVAKRLLLVIAAFVLCWLPRVVAEIYAATLAPDPRVNLISQALYVCKNIVPYFNSTLNPVLYSLVNPRFRHECRWIILNCFSQVFPVSAVVAAKYTCKSSSAL